MSDNKHVEYFDTVISPKILAYALHTDELLVRRIWDSVRRAVITNPPPANQVPEKEGDCCENRSGYCVDCAPRPAAKVPVAEVVSGYSGDPDTKSNLAIKPLDLSVCRVGDKLFTAVYPTVKVPEPVCEECGYAYGPTSCKCRKHLATHPPQVSK